MTPFGDGYIDVSDQYKSWSACSSCGFRGIFLFIRWDEAHSGADSLGAMFDSTCPACGEHESVLVAAEEIEAMTVVPNDPDAAR